MSSNMYALRSEQLSKRLYWAMSIIILCLLIICIPLIVTSTQNYIRSIHTYKKLQALQEVTVLANKISRERAPANKLMSSTTADFEQHQQDLAEYRYTVNQQLEHTATVLKNVGLVQLSEHLYSDVKVSLNQGRQKVDQYALIPKQQRSAHDLDQAILAMFTAWERCRTLIHGVVVESDLSASSLNSYITQIILLSDLRDQAGRVASNVMAHVTFGTPLPRDNLTRSLQTQHQVYYLWDLIATIQPQHHATPEFSQLHRNIENIFIQQGLPIVAKLREESLKQQPYHLTGTELTNAMVDKFKTVVDLQTYLLQHIHEVAEQEKASNLRYLLWTILVSLVSLVTAIITMIYARRSVFVPLIQARQILFDLSRSRDSEQPEVEDVKNKDTLFAAIQKLEDMLQQRDALEFRLKNIAHSDSLTGLSNRFALEEYTKFLEAHPSKFSQTCLMIIDIDHFKQVNDQYGHRVGDEMIRGVTACLKDNVRASDFVVRYGGDEFLVLIENIEMSQSIVIADKIRAEISATSILDPDGNEILVSVSVGVAVGADSWLELFEKADTALFKAKAAGRNAVAS